MRNVEFCILCGRKFEVKIKGLKFCPKCNQARIAHLNTQFAEIGKYLEKAKEAQHES